MTDVEAAPVLSALRRRLPRLPGGMWIGFAVLAVIVLIALLAPHLSPYDGYKQNIMHRQIPPAWNLLLDGKGDLSHPLGTDRLGRDYWARIALGARVSLIVGFVAALVATAIGMVMGVLAGYYGSRIDAVMMFLLQTRLAMPVTLVALTAVSLLGGSLLIVTLVASLLLWDRAAVVSRSVTQQVRALDYVKAARALGATDLQIMRNEILPSLVNPLAVITTVEMSHAVILEASLSFLGLGLKPPTPSWGLMLAEAKQDIFFAPWAITIPGAAIFILLIAVTLIGDGLQDLRARRRA
jgi:peptide/nickel transport system permease protein